MVKHVNPDELEEIKQATKLVFCDVWAEWCRPCISLAPILEELDNKYSSNPDIDFEEFRKKNNEGFDKIVMPILKKTIEDTLSGEFDSVLGCKKGTFMYV